VYRSALLFPRPLDKALGSFGNILDSNSLLWLLDPLLDHDVQPIVTNACAALYRLAHGQVSFRCNPNGLEGCGSYGRAPVRSPSIAFSHNEEAVAPKERRPPFVPGPLKSD
jgi:hypothetical protein